MKTSKEQARDERVMSKRALKNTKGGSQVGGLIFSSFRDSANPNGGVKCEHSGNNPEPRQGPLQMI